MGGSFESGWFCFREIWKDLKVLFAPGLQLGTSEVR